MRRLVGALRPWPNADSPSLPPRAQGREQVPPSQDMDRGLVPAGGPSPIGRAPIAPRFSKGPRNGTARDEKRQACGSGLEDVLLPFESVPAKAGAMAEVPKDEIADYAEDDQRCCEITYLGSSKLTRRVLFRRRDIPDLVQVLTRSSTSDDGDGIDLPPSLRRDADHLRTRRDLFSSRDGVRTRDHRPFRTRTPPVSSYARTRTWRLQVR
jgi:hypothetical protein